MRIAPPPPGPLLSGAKPAAPAPGGPPPPTRGLVGQGREGVEFRIDPGDPVGARVHHLDGGDLLPPYQRRQLGRRQPAEPPVSHPRTPFVRTASSQDERWNTTILSSVISLIAYAGPSLPNPDSLRPP